MRAVDVMTPHVICVGPQASAKSIAKLMADRGISGVPVIDSTKRVIGMISEGDLLRRIETGTEPDHAWWLAMKASTETMTREYVQSHARRAKDIMTRDVVTISPNTELSEVATLLETKHIKRVPVVKNDKLIGIVSRANLIRAFGSAPARVARKTTDQKITGRLLGEIQRQRWANDASVSVIVKDGVVHLWGACTSQNQRRALLVAAETVPGVKHVIDHITPPVEPIPSA